MDEITGHALELLKIILYICGVFSVYCGLQYMFMADWPMFFFLLPINVVFIYYVKLRLKGEIYCCHSLEAFWASELLFSPRSWDSSSRDKKIVTN